MDYSKLSDFDINCEVLAILSPDIKHMCLSGDNSCFYDCGPTGDGWHQIDIPDYCNNPADAWPIIVDNRITVMIDDTTNDWSAALVQDFCDISAFKHSNCHKNPLRAAMVTFLMMQDSANVQANSTGSDIR
ncbi:DUF2591 family protein [Citrobacter freundii]|nr:DUF2591 family protein [Citrobacter freundii]RXM23549.1 DUF2591 domain-containing protein [Citrobacter sp. AAK_AS5]